MELDKAKETIEVLANGINPVTGEVLAREGPYNDPIVIRSLFTILESLKSIRPQRKTPEQRQDDNVRNGKPRNSGLPWTTELKAEIAAKFKQDSSVRELAKHFERSSGAITSELVKQGLIEAPEIAGHRQV